ncbi:hypothetical protein ATCC90586_001536 [Pythium insidiosum]|nr:hypothetical protein ATCC90586_001536 [Pythium insidiosum]
MDTAGRGVRASIDFNGPLSALSTSPSRRLVAVGGREVLKVVALEASGFAERRNLRVGKSNLNFSTNDIRWHPQSESLLATAATNGTVVIWNLQRDGFKNVQGAQFGGQTGSTQTTTLLQQLDHVNPLAMQGFDPYPYDSRGVGGDRAQRSQELGVQYRQNAKSSAILHGSAVYGELAQLRDQVLKELLEYYVDIGDLQTAVAVAFVVNQVTNVEKVMGKSWLQQIYMHYVDLLHQLRIYYAANELILHCPDQSIRQMNMMTRWD